INPLVLVVLPQPLSVPVPEYEWHYGQCGGGRMACEHCSCPGATPDLEQEDPVEGPTALHGSLLNDHELQEARKRVYSHHVFFYQRFCIRYT
ncbi:hypothetical protein XENOCAPTIV_018788, partial [Xenoophorus captivus]